MPFHQDVEDHMAAVLDNERQLCSKRLTREQERSQWAKEAAATQVAAARGVADRDVAVASDDAEAAVERAERRLQQERRKCDAELQAAKARAAEVRADLDRRIAAAEVERDASRPVAEERVRKFDALCRAATRDAEASAAEAVRLSAARGADAERREAAAAARGGKLRADGDAREAKRVEEVERKASALQAESQQRAERAGSAAADQLEAYLARMFGRRALTEADWALSQQRVEAEVKRNAGRSLTDKALSAELSAKACRRHDTAQQVEAFAEQAAAALRTTHEQRHLAEMARTADEVATHRGLEELVLKLRSGSLWRDLTDLTDVPPQTGTAVAVA